MNYKKIISAEEIENLIANLRKPGKKIVFTNGCFDILHVGHIRYLKEAKSFGDILIVGLNSDSSVKKLKGPSRPINGENDRAEVLASLESVDYITIFNDDTPSETIEKVKPDIHAKGGDYLPEDLPERNVVEKYGGKVKIIKFHDGFSTTGIINKMNKY
jgi:glycerol-3-phosphate cytidylyltransferase